MHCLKRAVIRTRKLEAIQVKTISELTASFKAESDKVTKRLEYLKNAMNSILEVAELEARMKDASDVRGS